MSKRTDIQARRANLSPAKRALLEQRLNNAASPGAASSVIPRRSAQSDAPLSFAQERIWFLQQLQPHSPAYNRPLALRLTGPLNVDALAQALTKISERHEVLRATFPAANGQPAQVISPARPLLLPVVEIGGSSATEREAQARRLAVKESQRPFNLSQGPLLRAALLRLGPEEHVLLLVVHHIIFDAWSAQVLQKELITCYNAFATENSSLPAELPIQYPDFTDWQRRQLQENERFTRQLAYWKERLTNAPSSLNLPTDRPRPAMQTHRGAQHTVTLPASLLASLNALGQQAGVTLYMALLAAFNVLLHRYTGQTDIVIGSPVAGRPHAETEGLIGFFLNTLALRTDLSGNPTFQSLLAQVKQTALEAYDHQELPFEKLVQALKPERNLSHTPLFQVMFNLENFSQPMPPAHNLRVDPFEFDPKQAMVDLTLEVNQHADGLRCVFEYNTHLFEATTIARMAGHFQTLLAGIAANPAQPIGSLPLLTQAERHQIVVEWNDTHAEYPRDKCIHQLFEAQAEQTPDAVAVVCGSQQLTYRELNHRANQLAHHLQKRGVGPDVLVGICVERSMEMIVGILGILKAGGAYVPLDPSYPPERLLFMLADSNAALLLTQTELAAALPQLDTPTLCLDSDWSRVAGESRQNPAGNAAAQNLAYIIYTSGSTGQPKGVAITHRAVTNFVQFARRFYQIGSDDRVLQFASFNFDAAVEEIFPALASGAAVVLRPELLSSNLADFIQWVGQVEITVLDLPTAFWHTWVGQLAQALIPPSVRVVIVGGEKALPEVYDTWQKYVNSQMSWFNTYGPSEATVVSLVYKPANNGAVSPNLPIGRPIDNVRAYILDEYLNPVPIGRPGELHIGGDGLARDYLNRPDLTAEKFIPNPFGHKPGERLYKTGDLARYLPDGNIEFLGRIDNQVKIRGFRIEPGEIETALRSHPNVQSTVVVAQKDGQTGNKLVAYVVVQQKPGPTTSELRDFLGKKLPDYMIPSSFVRLEKIPLTPNGKINRQALPAPEQTRPHLEETFVAPQSTVEKTIAKIWSQVLGLKQVGVHDNFFELGGHSLLLIQVHAQLQEKFTRQFSVIDLFKYPTIKSLAQYLSQTHDEAIALSSVQRRAQQQQAAINRQKQQRETDG